MFFFNLSILNYLQFERSDASSVEIGGTVVVVGGADDTTDPTAALEVKSHHMSCKPFGNSIFKVKTFN